MIRLAELSAPGPFVAAASAALLLFAVWLLLRRRLGVAGNESARRPHSRDIFQENALVKPTPPFAFIASIFLHLNLISLIPYAGIIAPEIVLRSPRSELVLIEYRLPHGTVIGAPGYISPALEPQAEKEPVAVANISREWRQQMPVERPTDLPAKDDGADRPDIVVARFDTVIQLFPLDPPEAAPIAEIFDSPEFILAWRPPRTRPGPVVLTNVAAFSDIGALPDPAGAQSGPNTRDHYEVLPVLAGAFVNAPLAEYGPPMSGLPVPVPNFSGPFIAQLIGKDFAVLLFGADSSRDSKGHQISSLTSSRHAQEDNLGEMDAPERGIPFEGDNRTFEASRQNQAQPVDRRRHGIILVGSGTRAPIPAAEGWLTGNPIYTVYLNVPGSVRRWVLQFCRPGRESRRLEISNGVIRLRQRHALQPPFARRTEAVHLNIEASGHWGRAAVFARLDSTGAMSNLRILSGPGGENGDRILASLRAWEFVPAFEDGEPVAVEAVFSIPLN